MIGNTELTEELVRLLDEHPREARDNRLSSTLCGEMAVMRLLHNSRQKMTAGELSSRLDMTTSRIAAVLGSLQKKGLLERESDEKDRRRVLVFLTEAGDRLCEREKVALHEQNIADALHAWRGCADLCSSPRARV